MTRPRLSRASVLLLAALAAGCASLPLPDLFPASAPQDPARQAWEARRPALAALAAWGLNGRVAVAEPGQSWQATLQWRQRGEEYDIDLSGPLGQGAARLHGEPGRVALRTDDGTTHLATSAETLLAQEMGWQLPVSGLRWWIRGLPDPATAPAGSEFDQGGHLTRLEQDGWSMEFLRYDGVGGLELPGKLFLENRELKVRLVIDRWEL